MIHGMVRIMVDITEDTTADITMDTMMVSMMDTMVMVTMATIIITDITIITTMEDTIIIEGMIPNMAVQDTTVQEEVYLRYQLRRKEV